MAKNDVKPPGGGLDVAKQAAAEQNADKVHELAKELSKKLDAQSAQELDKITPADKTERKTA